MLAFQYENTPSKVYSYAISDALANIWNTSTFDFGSSWMLVNNDVGCFYIQGNGGGLGYNYKVQKRSISDGSLLAVSDVVYSGVFYLCQVDANGDIWCYDTHGRFYKLDASTLAITTYTLKAGWDSDGDNEQQYACMTFDGLYFYVTGYTGSRVAKFSVANLDGGDPEWYVDLGDLQAFRIYTDSNNDVYVANQNYDSPYYISIRKLDGDDGSVLWGATNTGTIYGGFLCYHAGHHSIYVPWGANTVRQIDADTGLEIGTSASTGSTVYCCAVGIDGNTLFVGHKDSGITTFDVTSNWSGGESNSGWYTVVAGKRHSFTADPTGYLNSLFAPITQVATPTATPDSCSFVPPLKVVLSCATSGATIYYTTDWTDPDEESEVYTTPLCLIGSTRVKAKAYKDGYTSSEVATFDYSYASANAAYYRTFRDGYRYLRLLREDAIVKARSIIETVYLTNNLGYLKITDNFIDVNQLVISSLGNLRVTEPDELRIQETPGHNILEIVETSFDLIEVDSNNLTITPKSATKSLKQIWS